MGEAVVVVVVVVVGGPVLNPTPQHKHSPWFTRGRKKY